MSRILSLQGLSVNFAPIEDASSTSSLQCCACSTSSECSCFMSDDIVAL